MLLPARSAAKERDLGGPPGVPGITRLPSDFLPLVEQYGTLRPPPTCHYAVEGASTDPSAGSASALLTGCPGSEAAAVLAGVSTGVPGPI